MPKTYNQRQIDQIRLEDAHTPQARDAPDVTRFIRYFSSEEVRQIVRRLEQSVAAGKVTQLKPETAYLVVANAIMQLYEGKTVGLETAN